MSDVVPAPVARCDDYRIVALNLLIDVRAGISARLAPVYDEHGISEHDFGALLRIAQSPDGALRMSELARLTCTSTSGMTRIVDRLQRHRLVAREPDPSDRRVLHVRLTPAGQQKLSAVFPDLLDAIDRWFTGQLPPGEFERVLSGLGALRDVLFPETGHTCSSAPELPAPRAREKT